MTKYNLIYRRGATEWQIAGLSTAPDFPALVEEIRNRGGLLTQDEKEWQWIPLHQFVVLRQDKDRAV